MKNFFVCLICICVSRTLSAQAPGIEWQNAIGGNDYDRPYALESAHDGGYFLGGYSNSEASIDKSEKYKGGTDYYDYWIIKCDAKGNILWENTIGGKRDDWNTCIYATPDNGCIVGGFSQSPAGADKSEGTVGLFSMSDYWILKLDASGHIIWQNTIGSTSVDYMYDLCPTPDGGYLLFGESYGGVGGDKTTPTYGGYDFWVIKVDASGNIVWQQNYGGIAYEHAKKIIPASGGGYYLAGESYSGISGTKLESSRGDADLWIIKIDESGNEVWQKTIGSSQVETVGNIIETSDNGLVICAYSAGAADGDKTTPSLGMMDYWLIKLNADGLILWQQSYGGSGDDNLCFVDETNSGELRIAGQSASPVSGNKTIAAVAYSDVWVIQTSSTGAIEWQQGITGDNPDLVCDVLINDNNETVILVFGYSGSAFDKFEPNYVGNDFWLVALADSCATETCNDLDDNCDGLVDNDVADSVVIYIDGPLEFCSLGSTHLIAYYTGNTIQWNRNGNPIATATSSSLYVTKNGTYTATTIGDCGSSTSNPVVVTVNANPNAVISAAGATTFCPGGSVVLNVTPVAGCTYQWIRGPYTLVGATGASYTATTSGNYKCTVTKTATGCHSTSNTIGVSATCREGEIGDFTLDLYPNPATNYLTIAKSGAPIGDAYVVNALGVVLYHLYTEADSDVIDISAYPSGMYWIRLGDTLKSFVKE